MDPLFPLEEFYPPDQFPSIKVIDPGLIPDPQRHLLVHDSDMTTTLERFHGGVIELKVLRCWWSELSLLRQVVLVLSDTQKPVEFGAIRIDLTSIHDRPRQVILENRIPFGAILKQYLIDHECHPAAFLAVEPDDLMIRALQMKEPAVLYGRCNTLLSPHGRMLAEVVEILPPMGHPQSEVIR
jgi:hypothetical protein